MRIEAFDYVAGDNWKMSVCIAMFRHGVNQQSISDFPLAFYMKTTEMRVTKICRVANVASIRRNCDGAPKSSAVGVISF